MWYQITAPNYARGILQSTGAASSQTEPPGGCTFGPRCLLSRQTGAGVSPTEGVLLHPLGAGGGATLIPNIQIDKVDPRGWVVLRTPQNPLQEKLL